MLCRRSKIDASAPAVWIKEQLRGPILVGGAFDSVPNNRAKVAISCEVNGEELEDRTFYVASIDVAAEYAGQSLKSVTHLFQKRSPITQGQAVRVLCPVVFSSPFTQHDSTELVELQNRSVEAKSKERVISFIRRQLDEKFRNVDAKTGFRLGCWIFASPNQESGTLESLLQPQLEAHYGQRWVDAGSFLSTHATPNTKLGKKTRPASMLKAQITIAGQPDGPGFSSLR